MATAPTPGRVNAGPSETFVTITVDGNGFTLYPNLLTASDASAVRAQTGHSVRKLIELAEDDPDIDVIAALVWVARCQSGEKINFGDVAVGLTYHSDLDVEAGEQPVPEDHPSS